MSKFEKNYVYLSQCQYSKSLYLNHPYPICFCIVLQTFFRCLSPRLSRSRLFESDLLLSWAYTTLLNVFPIVVYLAIKAAVLSLH